MELFWAKGYDNTSIAELSETMGVAPPSLYAAFGDKEGLFREAVGFYCKSEGTDIWEAFSQAPTAQQAVETFLIRSAYSFTRRNRPRGCMIVLSGLHDDADQNRTREDLKAHRRQNLMTIHQRLAEGVAAGELPAKADVNSLARFYLTVQEGMSVQARDGASRQDLLDVVNTAMAAWPSRGAP
jgi:AcrR family transcriptional regulator